MLAIGAKAELQQRLSSSLMSQVVIVVAFVMALVGCSGGSYAPVSDRNVNAVKQPKIFTATTAPRATQQIYRVQQGDTLFSIAFRYGKDYEQLASGNDIDSGYKIYPGQLINLAATSSPAQTKKKTTKKQSVIRNKPLQDNKGEKLVKSRVKIAWVWPVKGKVIQGFSDKGVLNKGINVSAAIGTAVYAAASGEVVYAGSGLLGYGNLIIIKHSSNYLSAYAHNSRLQVNEKDRVKQSEKIAEVGDSGTVRPMLHFEIRKDGKPVNPLKYLP